MTRVDRAARVAKASEGAEDCDEAFRPMRTRCLKSTDQAEYRWLYVRADSAFSFAGSSPNVYLSPILRHLQNTNCQIALLHFLFIANQNARHTTNVNIKITGAMYLADK
jgi:hypothetical protein